VADRSSNDVLNIVLFNHCLQVDSSRSLIILECFDFFLTWWPPDLLSNMALIEVVIDI
jgi:hypothetical protein